MTTTRSLPTRLLQHIGQSIERAGGWIGFDRYMALALYTPGLGYYANASSQFGRLPGSGSDFVTAPELSSLFGAALAVQLAQALDATGTDTLWEFGAGSGALAQQLLQALGGRVKRYHIVDLSGTLRQRQQARLASFGDTVQWLSELPEAMEGVVVGNEVLDAMPVKVLVRAAGAPAWQERGVALTAHGAFAFAERPSALCPPLAVAGEHAYLTEIHPQAEAFMATLVERLLRSDLGGAAFFIDYGFPEAEYYHAQRHMGTLMCHRAHLSDTDALADVGLKDITAHVNFTAMALAAQDAGADVLGYTSQARFLINCGLVEKMAQSPAAQRVDGLRLLHEHEMGELFKVLAIGVGPSWDALGFASGDRSHTL